MTKTLLAAALLAAMIGGWFYLSQSQNARDADAAQAWQKMDEDSAHAMHKLDECKLAIRIHSDKLMNTPHPSESQMERWQKDEDRVCQ